MDGYTVRASGSVGCEIMSPEGTVVAWANRYWAAGIVALLNDAQERGLRPFRDMSGVTTGQNWPAGRR